MTKDSNEGRSKNGLYFISGTLVVALVIGLVLLAKPNRDATLARLDDAAPTDHSQDYRYRTAGSGAGSTMGSEPSAGARSTTGTLADSGVTTSTVPERTESDPISYHVDDFRQFQTLLDEYTVEGLQQTAEGLTLLPAEDPTTTEPRIGTLVSPVLPLTMPTNAISPMWRIKTAPDSGVNIEVAISSDGDNFTEFIPVGVSDGEIEQFYPDGSPNPNYGVVAGGLIAQGNKLYTHAIYRLTMTAGAPESPVLEEVRLFHTDSTMGNGVLAEMPEPTGAETIPVDAPPVSDAPPGSETPPVSDAPPSSKPGMDEAVPPAQEGAI